MGAGVDISAPSTCQSVTPFAHPPPLTANPLPYNTMPPTATPRIHPPHPTIPLLPPITLHRLEVQRRAYYKRRSYYAAAGVVFGMIAIYLTATPIDLNAYPPKPTKLDSP